MVASLQNVAVFADPISVSKAVHKAGSFINVHIDYLDKSYKPSNPEGIPLTYDLITCPWYKQVVDAGKSVTMPPCVSASIGQLVVTFIMPILGGGTLKGVIDGDMAMNSVIANVKVIHPTRTSSGFLVNAAGKIVVRPNDKLTLKPIVELAIGLNETTLASLVQADRSAEVMMDGASRLLCRQGMKDTSWGLMVTPDEPDATAGIRSLAMTLIGALVGVTVIVALVVDVMTMCVFHRLSVIRDAMGDVGSGNGGLIKCLPLDGEGEAA